METYFLDGVNMQLSRAISPSLLSLLFLGGLVISGFILPIGYTYDEVCPKCKGDGNVTCEKCHGSGKCPVCDGTGEIWYMPGDGWCAFCQGTGKCSTCGGKGWHICGECGGTGLITHWMYNLAGAAVITSLINILIFLGVFILGAAASAFYLSFNEWVHKVEDMNFWFNRSFMTWLFAKHRDRWAKWQTGLSLILSVYFGILIFWILSIKQVTQNTLVVGVLFSIGIAILYSYLFYGSYISHEIKSCEQ